MDLDLKKKLSDANIFLLPGRQIFSKVTDSHRWKFWNSKVLYQILRESYIMGKYLDISINVRRVTVNIFTYTERKLCISISHEKNLKKSNFFSTFEFKGSSLHKRFIWWFFSVNFCGVCILIPDIQLLLLFAC